MRPTLAYASTYSSPVATTEAKPKHSTTSVRVQKAPIAASIRVSSSAIGTVESGAGDVLVIGIQPTHGIPHKLRTAGFTVYFAKTAADARQFANDRVPVAILLGPGPGSDPYDVLRWLRSQERLAFVQIFIFAEHHRRTFRVRDALTAGADDVFDLLDQSHGAADLAADRIVARIARSRIMMDLALLDPLTGLHNRRFMNDRLPAEIARAARMKTALSVALLDLDNFKTINDTLGHAAGDRVLTAFARALQTGLRAYDVVCRWGGDEFIVLFPDCGLEGAHRALDQLRARRSVEGPWSAQGDPITFSAGVAEFPEAGSSWNELFERADANLRRAKQSGRDVSV